MGNNLEKRLTDRDVQLFFDAAEKLREAAEYDGEKARKTTAELASFINRVDARLQRLENDVSHKISSSAEITANRAADLLSVQFRQANEAAQRATEQYQYVAKSLNFRNWFYILGSQIVLVLVFIALIVFLVPSLDEIQQRRAQLTYLNKQLDGPPFQWGMCGKEKCFRTDERNGKGAKDKDGNTWRVPWKE